MLSTKDRDTRAHESGRSAWSVCRFPLLNSVKVSGYDPRLRITFQAVVCIGGDGTFAEVFNGLVLRAAKDQQIDPNEPDVRLPNPALPVGVIPSGSTDTVAYSLHGTTDVQTAAIHIIFGDSIGLDISSVHTNRNLLRLYASVLSYGYLGDVIRDSEKFRWMGPRRYDWSGKFRSSCCF